LHWYGQQKLTAKSIKRTHTKNPKYNNTYKHMHTNLILTGINKRRTHAQSKYTNTKLKARFRCL